MIDRHFFFWESILEALLWSANFICLLGKYADFIIIEFFFRRLCEIQLRSGKSAPTVAICWLHHIAIEYLLMLQYILVECDY